MPDGTETQQAQPATQPQPAANVPATRPERPVIPIDDDGVFDMLLDTAKFAQLQRIGTMYSRSKLVPAHFQGDEPSCMVATQMAMRLHVDPLMFMQKSYIVQNKPGMEAQLAIALINTRGPFTGPIDWNFEYDEKTKKCIKATAFATHKVTGRVCSATVDWALVQAEGWDKKSGSKWLTMPEQMFAYRSAVFLGRRYCPEVLMGMATVDELHEELEINPAPPQEAPEKEPRRRSTLRERVVGVQEASPIEGEHARVSAGAEAAEKDAPAAQEAAGATQAPTDTQPQPEPAKTAPAASARAEPAVSMEHLRQMVKKAKTKDQADVIIDTVNDPSYTEEERDEIRKAIAAKDLGKPF